MKMELVTRDYNTVKDNHVKNSIRDLFTVGRWKFIYIGMHDTIIEVNVIL